MAIKKLVFDEKKLTMAELLEALDNDFAGERGEEIRQMCLNAPKFGNGNEEVDDLAGKIGRMSAESIYTWDHSPYPAFKSLREGGTHIQYNIVDNEELKDAKVNPDEHRDLIVRVGGFSAYFVQLSDAIQNDVNGRSEHMI